MTTKDVFEIAKKLNLQYNKQTCCITCVEAGWEIIRWEELKLQDNKSKKLEDKELLNSTLPYGQLKSNKNGDIIYISCFCHSRHMYITDPKIACSDHMTEKEMLELQSQK